MHESNGIVERHWRTLTEMTLSLLLASGLPLRFWAYASLHSNYIRARMPHSTLSKELNVTPYHKWYNKDPTKDLKRVRIFGTECYNHIDQSLRKKLNPGGKARKCIYLGQTEDSTSCLVFDLEQQHVTKGHMVRFHESIDNNGKLKAVDDSRKDELLELVRVHERRGVKDVIAFPNLTEFPVLPMNVHDKNIVPFSESGAAIGCSKCKYKGCRACTPNFVPRSLRSNTTVQPPLPPAARPQQTINPELPDQPDESPLEEEPSPMDTGDFTVDSLLNILSVKNFKEMSAVSS
jgi:hypothetical protein